jgi:hypothetical protein
MLRLKISPELDAEIGRLAELLATVGVDQILTYREMNLAIGRDVQNEARYSLMRAQQRAEREHGIRYATLHNVGKRRLKGDDLPSIGAKARQHIRKAAKRGYRRLGDLAGNVPSEVQRRIDAERAALGTISLFTREHVRRKIETEVERAGPLSMQKTLDLFTRNRRVPQKPSGGSP